MRRVFKDNQLEDTFHRDGYAVVKLLEAEDIQKTEECIEEINKTQRDKSTDANSSYKLSFFNTDLEFKKHVFKTLTEFFQPYVDNVLNDYVPLIINIFDKEPGKGEVPIHQNWTFVDEDKFTSVSVWIPLVDVSRENGSLEVVKGSHKVLCKYRSPSLPWVFDELNETLKQKYLQPFVFEKGHAGIIDDGILHWSSDNNTDQVRTAVQLILMPRDAEAIHYHYNQETGLTDVYRVDPEFFMQFNMKDIPAGYEIIDRKKIDLKKLTEEEFKSVVSQNNPEILQV